MSPQWEDYVSPYVGKYVDAQWKRHIGLPDKSIKSVFPETTPTVWHTSAG